MGLVKITNDDHLSSVTTTFCRHGIFADYWRPYQKTSSNTDTFQPSPVVRQTDALPHPSESLPLELSDRFPECRPNNPARDGSRLSGNRTGSADRALPIC